MTGGSGGEDDWREPLRCVLCKSDKFRILQDKDDEEDRYTECLGCGQVGSL